MIGVTQPRRVGAVSVARRVAEEMNTKLGEIVGYTVRFDGMCLVVEWNEEDCTSKDTRIRFLTDGCLLRECLFSPNLSAYSVVIVDEAHERSLQTDILFGLIKDILSRREDIKFVITSATLDATQFSKFFANAPTLHVEGRCFPVDIQFAVKTETRAYVEKAVEHAVKIHASQPLGDILVFLTGEEEIQRACRLMGDRVDALDRQGVEMPDIVILAAYASLSAHLQQQVFAAAPPNCRKVIFSTNICETSLTVDGVVYVIDAGFVKQRIFNPLTGMDALVVVPISQVQAVQRAGRAGRTCEGKCIRLYSSTTFETEMPAQTQPEIKRSNLCSTVLLLKEFGVVDPLAFNFLDPPEPDAIIEALHELYWLGALDERGNLTSLGKQMGQFPLDPPLSKLIISSIANGCWSEILTITAMVCVYFAITIIQLSCENLYERPATLQLGKEVDARHKSFASEFGDHITLLRIYEGYMEARRYSDHEAQNFCQGNYLQLRALEKVRAVRSELEEIVFKCYANSMEPNRPSKNSEIAVTQCRRVIAETYFYHCARKAEANRYRPVVNKNLSNSLANSIFIHPNSSLILFEPKWVVYAELNVTSKPFMKTVCVIEYEWIKELLPKIYTTNIHKLTGRAVIPLTLEIENKVNVDPELLQKEIEEREIEAVVFAEMELGKRKKIEETVSAAKQRYLERKNKSKR